MDFNTDIHSLFQPSKSSFNLVGAKLPTANDIYYRAKQKELLEQYEAARIFMHETGTTDWNHWFNPVKDPTITEAIRLIFKSHFYETALFFYNAVVDISWTLCYVAIEFACNCKGQRVDISGIKPIEEAAELLRSAERNVTSPTGEENPFEYLKLMCPEFVPVIDYIIGFWLSFSPSGIRQKYNFCKHKGRPSYEEIAELNNGRVFGFYYKDKSTGQTIQVASDPQDVSYSFSLEDSILELKDFDDNTLFPYIQNLFNMIEGILKPSPLIM